EGLGAPHRAGFKGRAGNARAHEQLLCQLRGDERARDRPPAGGPRARRELSRSEGARAKLTLSHCGTGNRVIPQLKRGNPSAANGPAPGPEENDGGKTARDPEEGQQRRARRLVTHEPVDGRNDQRERGTPGKEGDLLGKVAHQSSSSMSASGK